MADKQRFTVSTSPHVRSSDTVTGIMLDVIIALLPASIAGVWIFGGRAAAVIAVSVISCILFEHIWNKILKKPNSIGDLSAIVTGILLALNMPYNIPLWIVVVGSLFAIIIVKQFFGGLGQNFVNPAIAGRIVLLVSFPMAMSNFVSPSNIGKGIDAVSSATPLGVLAKTGIDSFDSTLSSGLIPSIKSMFLGDRGGTIGEVCAFALIIGFIWLLTRRVISLIIPLSFIGSLALIMLIAGGGNLNFMVYQVLSGGLLLGAIFMATDYATSPVGRLGKVIFGVGCGVITAVIRLYGSMNEGISYAILLMNILVPHIERLCLPKPFGVKEEEAIKKAESANKEVVK